MISGSNHLYLFDNGSRTMNHANQWDHTYCLENFQTIPATSVSFFLFLTVMNGRCGPNSRMQTTESCLTSA